MKYHHMYKVVVVEDEPIILENVISKIENTCPLFKVAGKAANGAKALSLVHEIQPDVLFTDIKMPMMDGLELIKLVRKDFPEMPIVILSGYSDFEYAQQAIKLGVRDYLLKPVKAESISDTLASLIEKLDSFRLTRERNVLTSEITGHSSEAELPYSLEASDFSLFLICLGNLYNHVNTPAKLKLLNDAWKSVNWNALLTKILNPSRKWWIVDEKAPNQKFVIISNSEMEPSAVLPQADILRNELERHIPDTSVTICATGQIISFSDIWVTAQDLRLQLERGLILGKSTTITPEKLAVLDRLPPAWDIQTQNKLVLLFQQGNKKQLKQELLNLFEKWNKAGYPQKHIEKSLHRLINLFQHYTVSMSEAETYHMEYVLNAILESCNSFPEAYQYIWNQLGSMFQSEYTENTNTRELVDSIEEYINKFYAQPLSLEDIARNFNFNPAYLTRVFKKYKGETPLKHIIMLRINEAKLLMNRYPDMDVKEIGEIIGYSDQHYFSRIFKNITGMTPSKFKENVNNIQEGESC